MEGIGGDSGQAGRQTDRHKTDEGRQADRQATARGEHLLCGEEGAGCPLDFNTNLHAINWVCLVPSEGSKLTITFREKR